MSLARTLAMPTAEGRSPASGSSRKALAAVLLLYAFALAIRLIGVDWQGVHDDENASASARILAGDLAASAFFYPPLLDYLVAAAYVPLFGVGLALGWWDGLDGFRQAFFVDRTPFFVAGRIVTAALGSTIAPLGYWMARDSGIRGWPAIAAGALLALLPGAVYWAHVAKSDSLLAPAFLLVLIAAARFIEEPRRFGRQALLGFAIAFAVSAKHSAVFFLAPALGLIALVSVQSAARWQDMAMPWVKVALWALLCWVPMNIGILLSPQRFVEAQIVQSQMSVRDASVGVTVRSWFDAVTSADAGIPLPVLALWPLTPILAWTLLSGARLRFYLTLLFAATLTAILFIGAIAGSRQLSHLLLPYASTMAAGVALTTAALLASERRWARAVGAAAGLLTLTLFAVRLGPILGQATMPPTAMEIGAAIRAHVPPASRIMAGAAPRFIPLSGEGPRLVRERHERLAAKYGLLLPPPETPDLPGHPDGYIVHPYPMVFGGLEAVDPDEIKVVLPYAWPLQLEEWRLPYWIARGYRYYLVDPAYFAAPVPVYRNFFQNIRRRCTVLAEIKSRRPLWREGDALLYRC